MTAWYEARKSVYTVTPVRYPRGSAFPRRRAVATDRSPHDHREHPPGVRVPGRPNPRHIVLGAHETPELVGLDHDGAGLFGGGPGSCGVSSRYTVLTNPWSHDRDTPTPRAITRIPSRSASRRRIRSLVASGIGPAFGAATNRRSHARHRNPGVPEWVSPLRTTWVTPQRGTAESEVEGALHLTSQHLMAIPTDGPLPISDTA